MARARAVPTVRYLCRGLIAGAHRCARRPMGAFHAITGEAERASAITCERCSEPGVLHETRYLVKTLCASCADSLGYTPVQQDTM